MDLAYFDSTVQHLSKQWKSNKTDNLEPLTLTINPQSEVFISKFDQIQDELETLASMDELLSGNSYLWLTIEVVVYLDCNISGNTVDLEILSVQNISPVA